MRVVALQDEDHRIVSSAGQWMVQHRSEANPRWATGAYCVTRHGVEFFLECEAKRGAATFMVDSQSRQVMIPRRYGCDGYLPLHLWPVVPDLPAHHQRPNARD